LIFDASMNEEIGVIKSLVEIYKDLLHQIDKDNHTPLSIALQE
jgi:hypothetical protein